MLRYFKLINMKRSSLCVEHSRIFATSQSIAWTSRKYSQELIAIVWSRRKIQMRDSSVEVKSVLISSSAHHTFQMQRIHLFQIFRDKIIIHIAAFKWNIENCVRLLLSQLCVCALLGRFQYFKTVAPSLNPRLRAVCMWNCTFISFYIRIFAMWMRTNCVVIATVAASA